MAGAQYTVRFKADVISSLNLECNVPDSVFPRLYDNSSNPSSSQCGVIALKKTEFQLIRVPNPSDVPAVIAGTATGSMRLTSSYFLAPCATSADCVNGGVCSKGVCQCAFGYCGAFCNARADDTCNLSTMVRAVTVVVSPAVRSV